MKYEEIAELDWRIYKPRTRRLYLYMHNEQWGAGAVPRLWLMDADRDDGPDGDILWITVDRETFFTKSWPHAAGRWQRFGTWKRYQSDVDWLKDLLEVLRWTLTDEEKALIGALEDYGRRAPARVADPAPVACHA